MKPIYSYTFKALLLVALFLSNHGCSEEEKKEIEEMKPEIQYSLSLGTSPSNAGSITKFPNQNAFKEGTSVKLTANPNSGYQFDHWENDVTGTTNPANIVMDANKQVVAVFTEVVNNYTLSLTTSPANGGSVTKQPDQNEYSEGTIVTLTANPASGYQFDQWQGDASGSDNPLELNMNGDKNITAVFSEVQPEIHLSANSLSFSAIKGESAPAPKTVTITNATDSHSQLDDLTISYPDGKPTWIYVTLNTHTAPATLTVSPQMHDPFGNYWWGDFSGRIAVNSAKASNSPQYIDVAFTIEQPSSLTAFASHDNGLMKSDMKPSLENQVFANSEIGAGVDYYWLIYGGYNYSLVASLLKFDIQSQITGRNIKSAKLRLYVYALRGDFNVTPRIKAAAIHSEWNPSTITYTKFTNMQVYSSNQVIEYAPNTSVVPFDFDVTGIVQRWASGTWNNNGFMLYPYSPTYPGRYSYQTTYFQSLEKYNKWEERPQIIIEFE